MSKRTDRKAKRRAAHPVKPQGTPPASDRAIYIGIGIVGFFVIVIGWLFTVDVNPEGWRLVALGYAAVILYLINVSAFKICRGKHLAGWQNSLARIPLRPIGYNTRGGKPLEVAHSHPEAMKAVITCIGVSVLVLAALSALLIPGVLW